MLETAQGEAVADLLLKLVEGRFPLGRDGGGFNVDGGDVPAQRLVEDGLQLEAPLLPRSRHAASLQRHRRLAPYVLQVGARHLLGIQVEHVRPVALAGPAHVAPAVQAPARAAFRGIDQRIEEIEIHQQRCVWEGVEVDVDQSLVNRPLGQIRPPAFAPIADGRDVHRIEIRVAVVTLAGLAHQRAPALDKQRIGGIRRPDFAILVRGLVGAARSGVAIPLGQRIGLIVRHQADGQRLVVLAGFVQRRVQNLPTILAACGLELRPEPAQVRHRGSRKLHRLARVGRGGLGPDFGPSRAGEQRLAGVVLEGLNAHIGIDQHIVDHLRTGDDGRLSGSECGQRRPQQGNADQHRYS
jgi:hypothetical protein